MAHCLPFTLLKHDRFLCALRLCSWVMSFAYTVDRQRRSTEQRGQYAGETTALESKTGQPSQRTCAVGGDCFARACVHVVIRVGATVPQGLENTTKELPKQHGGNHEPEEQQVREYVDAYDLCAARVSVQATIGERTGCTDLLDDANTVVFDRSVEPRVI